MLKISRCHLCGEDVTVPYFFNKKVYGYSCIEKVTGVKRKKSKEKYHTFEYVKQTNIFIYFKFENEIYVADKKGKKANWLIDEDKKHINIAESQLNANLGNFYLDEDLLKRMLSN